MRHCLRRAVRFSGSMRRRYRRQFTRLFGMDGSLTFIGLNSRITKWEKKSLRLLKRAYNGSRSFHRFLRLIEQVRVDKLVAQRV